MIVAVAVVAAVGWWIGHRSSAPPAGAPAPVATPAPAVKPRPTTPPPSAAPEEKKPRAARPKLAAPPPPTEAAPVAAPTKGTLHVTSDVAGASVFLDRNYLGTTPVTLDGVEPGQRRLNVSAEGYDGYAETVTIVPGPNEVAVRFKEVRLDAAIAVVHKHGIGSCAGKLLATTQGLRFDTSRKDDAFQIGFGDLEAFDIDYPKHMLKVKKRGGRTWNFTDTQATADALFVFHRDVQKARTQLGR